MGNSRPTRKSKAAEWLKNQNEPRVDEALSARLAEVFPGASADTLRAVVLESGLPLAPMVEGVRQDSFEHLEATLLALAGEYSAGDLLRQKAVRGLVKLARQHAEWASRNRKLGEERRAQKLEMELWIRTWLENPPLFADWVALRKRACHPPGDAM
jgi:hypothetical protein